MKRRSFIHFLGGVGGLSFGAGVLGYAALTPAVKSVGITAPLFSAESLKFLARYFQIPGQELSLAGQARPVTIDAAAQALQSLNQGEYDFLLTKSNLWHRISASSLYWTEFLKGQSKDEVHRLLFLPENRSKLEAVYSSLGLVSIPLALTDSTLVRLSRHSANTVMDRLSSGVQLNVATPNAFSVYGENFRHHQISWDQLNHVTDFGEIDLLEAQSVWKVMHSKLVLQSETHCLLDRHSCNADYVELVTTQNNWQKMPQQTQDELLALSSLLSTTLSEISLREENNKIERAAAKGLRIQEMSPELSRLLKPQKLKASASVSSELLRVLAPPKHTA